MKKCNKKDERKKKHVIKEIMGEKREKERKIEWETIVTMMIILEKKITKRDKVSEEEKEDTSREEDRRVKKEFEKTTKE